jgi:formylglycine-generating enzyme required for sulfatase activity/dienelactone hydrolase
MSGAGPGILLHRQTIRWGSALALAGVLAGGGWLWHRSSRVRWARTQALPQIARLAEEWDFADGLQLSRAAAQYIPDDPELARLLSTVSTTIDIETRPPGARISVQDYGKHDTPWESLGTAPVKGARVEVGPIRVRAELTGYETRELALIPAVNRQFNIELDSSVTAPAGMVHVPSWRQAMSGSAVDMPDYWLDRFEVSNRRFKAFVDTGGYEKRDYWKEPFLDKDKALSWKDAMAVFRDTTGRPGPSTWILGSYPDGQADFPVSGVSWYEAAAYAEFAGKKLPTYYHWQHAAGYSVFSSILDVSNFSGRGVAKGGEYKGLGPYGTYDMAGNVKEWCWNEIGGRRYVLGGAWNEPSYVFRDTDAHSPLERDAAFGFRCALYPTPPPTAAWKPRTREDRDYTVEKPASDEAFHLYRSIYAYDHTSLDPRQEGTDNSPAYWVQEKVSYGSGNGDERVPAYLMLPKNASAPYATIIYNPSSIAAVEHSSRNLELWYVDSLLRSGRAVLYPVYKGTYERRITNSGSNGTRDMTIQQAKEFGRSIDYLETRHDIDHERLAFCGMSRGASEAPMMLAFEPRIRTAVLIAGGFPVVRRPPEVDPLNFAPHVKIPILMINGRTDFTFPYESSQLPMFRFFGTPQSDKRHVVFEAGHVPPTILALKEILNWLDRYLGPRR